MTDRVVHAQDLDGLRGLSEDGSKAFVKVDGTTVKFNASGQLVAAGGGKLVFGATDPNVPGTGDSEEWFVTTDGTSAGAILAQWIWDQESSAWLKRPTPLSIPTTTSLTPVVYDGTAYVNAKANAEATSADVMKLADGTYIHDGKVTWTGHGLTVGSWYYLSQATAGAYVTPEPTSGWSQQLFFVLDANTILVDIEPAEYLDAPVGEDIVSPYMVTAYSTLNPALPGGYVADICKYNNVLVSECLGGAETAFNTSTYRFRPTRAGWYEVLATYDIFRGNGSESQIILRKNGSNILLSGSFGAITEQVVRVVYMNGTTDYVDVANLGSPASTRRQSVHTSVFQARWLHY